MGVFGEGSRDVLGLLWTGDEKGGPGGPFRHPILYVPLSSRQPLGTLKGFHGSTGCLRGPLTQCR